MFIVCRFQQQTVSVMKCWATFFFFSEIKNVRGISRVQRAGMGQTESADCGEPFTFPDILPERCCTSRLQNRYCKIVNQHHLKLRFASAFFIALCLRLSGFRFFLYKSLQKVVNTVLNGGDFVRLQVHILVI
jgi:hypothetical protein